MKTKGKYYISLDGKPDDCELLPAKIEPCVCCNHQPAHSPKVQWLSTDYLNMLFAKCEVLKEKKGLSAKSKPKQSHNHHNCIICNWNKMKETTGNGVWMVWATKKQFVKSNKKGRVVEIPYLPEEFKIGIHSVVVASGEYIIDWFVPETVTYVVTDLKALKPKKRKKLESQGVKVKLRRGSNTKVVPPLNSGKDGGPLFPYEKGDRVEFLPTHNAGKYINGTIIEKQKGRYLIKSEKRKKPYLVATVWISGPE